MRRAAIGIALALATATPAPAAIVVVAPHPDDEVLAAGGLIHDALALGEPVDVVVLTNGDYHGVSYGYTRQAESVAGLAVLGLREERVMFLGYPDAGLLALWNDAPSPSDAWQSPRTGATATYGARGFGGADLHTALTGVPAAYNRPSLVADVAAALARTRPAAIFTTGAFDHHPDHRATFYAVRAAVRAVAAADPGFRPALHATIVHDPVGYPYDDFWPPGAGVVLEPTAGNDASWPNPAAGTGVGGRFDPTVPYLMPPSLSRTILDWTARRVWPVPAAMADPVFDRNLKVQALGQYVTQVSDVLWAHVKADQFFWPVAIGPGAFRTNVARAATATATSAAGGQGPEAATDGIVDGAPGRPDAEWTTAAGTTVATLTLAWPRPIRTDRVVVYDRPGLADRVVASRLVLDDGTVVPVGALANDGRGDEVLLPGVHRVSRLAFVVEGARGTPGLAEIEVLGELPPPDCKTDAACDDGDPCTADRCLDQRCTAVAAADGTPCGDGDACNGVESCSAGVCERRPAPDCGDGDPCTRDVCEPPGTCRHDFTCAPAPARGRGGCRLAVVGAPARTCADGDPACDADATTNGACRFDLVLCVTDAPAASACRLRGALSRMVVRPTSELAGVVARLGAGIERGGARCAGPTAVAVAAGRRRRLAVRLFGADGRAERARLPLGCRRGSGPARRPPAPLVP